MRAATHPLAWTALAALAACAGDPAPEAADTGHAPADDTGAAPPDNPYGPAEGCPAFATGAVEVEVGGVARELQVQLPADPAGAPVVFAWHWLGGTGTQVLDWMGMRGLADQGFIVVAPESSGLPFEWDLTDPSDDNPDLALFDAALACLWEQHRVDADRVYATGMSAGGLMTTFLTLHRAEVLAATAPFSGGAFARDYATPAWDLPVLVTWGGPEDTYGGYDFHAASQEFAALLEADGHLAVRCMHDLGHRPPAEAADMVGRFFGDHARGGASPWADGLPEGLPAWCE